MASSTLVANLEAINKASFSTDEERVEAMKSAHALVARLENPFETAWRFGITNSSLKICDDLGLFRKWSDPEKALSVDEMSEMTGAEPLFLERILRHLDAVHLIEQVDTLSFKLTPFTKGLANTHVRAMLPFHYELELPMMSHLPSYAKYSGYKNPRDGNDCSAMQLWGRSFYDHLELHPIAKENFSNLMRLVAGSLTPWIEIFPTQVLVDSLKAGRALVVDCGGSQGHDLERMRDKYPDLPAGSLVLQDRPEIISLPEAQALKAPITPMGYDFFTPQPIRGARAYYFHHIFHNWSDADSLRILENVADAMEVEYSSLLIHELSNPTMHPRSFATSMDITMMGLVAALERSDQMWEDLLAKVGLKIVKIWRRPDQDEQIVEAVLA